MADTDQIDEDEVLRRMLSTPHEPHKPLGKKRRGRAEARPRSQKQQGC